MDGMLTQGSVEVVLLGIGMGIEDPGPISMAEAHCAERARRKATSSERAIFVLCWVGVAKIGARCSGAAGAAS